MTIETKYNIGEEVWFEWCGEIILAPIIGITISRDVDNCVARYSFSYYPINAPKIPLIPLPEEYVFPTKEELLKSL